MKGLAIASIATGAIGFVVALYGVIETAPNYDSVRARNMDALSISTIERAYETELIEAMFMQSIASWALGLVAIVLGILAIKRGAKAGWAGIGLAVVGAICGGLLVR